MTLSAPARPAGLEVPPLYVTTRDLTRRTLGGAVARVAAILGTPLMPWQRYVADVLGEVDETGTLVHPFGVVSVQRQAGKTQLDLAQSVQRCLYKPNRRIWHTAQTGQDAGEKWWELVEAVMRSNLRELVEGKPRKAQGSQALTFVNGSKLRPHPPTRDGLHGKQSDLNNIDEGWSFDEARGAELLQAITPTQATRPGAQTIVWSTMGDADSSWFHGLVDAAMEGRAVVEGVPPAAAFVWGIPEDVDPDDIEAVARYHPAVGYTQTVDTLRRARATPKMTREGFARAYGNRRTGNRTRVIPLARWDAASTVEVLPAGPVAYGAAVYEPRDGGDTSAALYSAVLDAAGRPVLELIEHRPGRNWLVQRIADLTDAGAGVAISRRGPAGPVADALELAARDREAKGLPAGVKLLPLDGTAEANACQDFWDRLCDADAVEHGPRLRYRAEPALDDAADVAGRRWVSAGAWVWDDEKSTGDVAPLKAATAAVHAALRPPEAPLVVGRSAFYA